MAKTYAKGSGSRKAKPTKDGEVQTAGLGALAAGAGLIAAPALGYYLGSTIKLVKDNYKTYKKNQKSRKELKELDQEDKDAGK